MNGEFLRLATVSPSSASTEFRGRQGFRPSSGDLSDTSDLSDLSDLFHSSTLSVRSGIAHHSTIPPFHHSTLSVRSGIAHHSTIPPFHHSNLRTRRCAASTSHWDRKGAAGRRVNGSIGVEGAQSALLGSSCFLTQRVGDTEIGVIVDYDYDYDYDND